MKGKPCATPRRGRGRPATFDRATALGQAMMLFWERGYEGTTFDELTQAMGLSPSSFYNAFGSKERLYQEAIDTFIAEGRRCLRATLAGEQDTRAAFQALLEQEAASFTQEDRPSGCMISLAGTHLPPALAELRCMLTNQRQATQEAMADRLRQGKAAGDVPADVDVEALAAFFNALIRGMAVQARDGASRARLIEIIEVAMRAWPRPADDRHS